MKPLSSGSEHAVKRPPLPASNAAVSKHSTMAGPAAIVIKRKDIVTGQKVID